MGIEKTTAAVRPANSGYSRWLWEQVLVIVLGIGFPDRSEVTARPWTTVQQNTSVNPGLHLIWTAGRDGRTAGGNQSVHVYLSPGLYDPGGAWDGFVNASKAPLAAASSGDYSGLPLDPATFTRAEMALASVMASLERQDERFQSLAGELAATPAGFKGTAAGALDAVLRDLRSASSRLLDRMSNPSYSAAVGSAGDAARRFLSDLWAAYNGWTQVPGSSPLGALVTVLTDIATLNGSAYTIPGAKNTRYGDLTTPAGWANVEAAAKRLWTSVLTGGSGEFGGLDPAARTALGKLVSQYETTIGTVWPLTAPTLAAISPASSAAAARDSGGPSGSLDVSSAGPGHPQVAHSAPEISDPQYPVPLPLLSGLRFSSTQSGLSNPQTTGTVLDGGLITFNPGIRSSGTSDLSSTDSNSTAINGENVDGADLFTSGQLPGPLTVSLLGQPVSTIFGPDNSTDPVADPVADLVTDPTFDSVTGSVSGLQADPVTDSVAHHLVPSALLTSSGGGPRAEGSSRTRPGFSGVIGRKPAKATDQGTDVLDTERDSTAPSAGVSLGRHSDGPVLAESPVPAIGTASRSPNASFNTLTTQLVPAESGPGLPGGPGSGLISSAAGPGGLTAPGGFTGQNGVAWQPDVSGGVLGREQIMPDGQRVPIVPFGGMGASGQQSKERERLAYLPEDENYWGTAPAAMFAAVGRHGRAGPPAPVEDENEGLIVIGEAGAGIGSRSAERRQQDEWER